jgi:hypothetical protein
MAVILWATLELAESARWGDWVGYGLLWGLALMTNPSLGSMLPLLLGWAAYRGLRYRSMSLSRSALALSIAFLCCVPWTIRNYVTFHRLIPLRSNFALELWAGNNDSYDETLQIVPPPDPARAELREYVRVGETAYMAEKWQAGTKFIRTHPRLEMLLWWRRFVAIWTGSETPWKSFLDAETLLVRVVLVTNLLAAIGALLGIFALIARRSIYALPLAAGPLIYPVLYYATHPSLRYRHPIDPALVILFVVGVSCFSKLLFVPSVQAPESKPGA